VVEEEVVEEDVVEELVEEDVVEEDVVEELVDEEVVDEEVVFALAQSSIERRETVSAPSSRFPRRAESTLDGSPLTIDLRRCDAAAVSAQSPAETADWTPLRAFSIDRDCAGVSRPFESEPPQAASTRHEATDASSASVVGSLGFTATTLDAEAEPIRH